MRETQRGRRRHLLLTKEIEKTLPKLRSTENVEDPIVRVKFFSPYSNWTWYATEGERREDGDMEFFGLVKGFETELGYFTLAELEKAKVFGNVPAVERDCYFNPAPLSKFKN